MSSYCRWRVLVVALVAASACSPAFDWREVHVEGSRLVATFPCRPGRHERDIAIANQNLRLTLLSCSADNVLFGVTFADVGDVARVAATLDALRVAVAHNIGAEGATASAFDVRGMTPNSQSLQMRLHGRRPDGVAVEGHVAVFSVGLQVIQIQVLAQHLDESAADQFFNSMRVAR